jgi:hypothetical protein
MLRLDIHSQDRRRTIRHVQVEIEASVASASVTDGTITLQFFSGTVTVQVDNTTLLDDDTDQADPLTVGDISSGDFLEVEAIQVGNSLVATRIDRDDQDDDRLQAQVESFNAGVDITLLGITFSTAGAEFENQNDNVISSETFFSQLQVGDLVKVKDEELADRVADEVEFEQDDALDGDEFDDDNGSDDDCDNSGSGSDDCDSEDDSSDDSDDDGSDDNSDSGSDDDSEDDSSDDNSGSP